eukprot:SAG31_NODE_1630_length_7699_cov_36.170921_5_plen_120_part_00
MLGLALLATQRSWCNSPEPNAFVLVAQALPEIARLDGHACERGTIEVRGSAWRSIAFFRAWCLVELAAAVDAGVPIVMRCGNAVVPSTALGMDRACGCIYEDRKVLECVAHHPTGPAMA